MASLVSGSGAVARSGRLSLVLGLLIAVSLRAQDTTVVSPDSAAVPRVVSGRIVRPGTTGMLPVPGVRVMLHRVGSDTAGPVDSMRAGPDGGYAFRYHLSGRADAVYFVSASYEGIAYFSLPLQKARVTGTDGEVTVFDTTSGPIPLQVRGRHIIIAAPSVDGSREIVEVYELTNDSVRTLVSSDDDHPIWTAVLPAGETDFSAGQSDVSVRAIREARGSIGIVAPFAPGLKQISFAYHMPARAFPLSMPLDHAASVLEVLTEEPTVTISGAGLAAVAPVAIEGRTFQRFTAQDVDTNAVIRVVVPTVGEAPANRKLVMGISIAMAALMLIALAWFMLHGRRRDVARAAPAAARTGARADARAGDGATPVDVLAREIALLDASYAHEESPTEMARDAYQARRVELKRALAALLDARNGGA